MFVFEELKAMVARIVARVSNLVTRAEIAWLSVKLAGLQVKLAGMPGNIRQWGNFAALLTAHACGLAALALAEPGVEFRHTIEWCSRPAR